MESTKLGRCECRQLDCHLWVPTVRLDDWGSHHTTEPRCNSDAVRMVTFKRVVRVYSRNGGLAQGIGWLPDWVNQEETKRVPMCAACADFHEKGGAK